MPSNHLILCHPLLLLPSIFPSIRSFPMSQFCHCELYLITEEQAMSFLIEFSWEPDWTPSPTRTLVFLLQMFWHWFFFYLQEKTRKVWILMYFQFLPNHSIQFSCSLVSDSLWPHELQHTRLPCPSPIPGVYSNSCPLSRWCHPTISSSVIPFSSHLLSFPASGSFQMSQLFASGGQSIGVSASTSVLPMNTQDWSPLGWTGWISVQSKGLSRVFSNTTAQKHQFFGTQLSKHQFFGTQLSSQSNSHIHTFTSIHPFITNTQ